MAADKLPTMSVLLRKLLGISKDERFYAVFNGVPGSGKTIFSYQMLWSYLQEQRKVRYSTTENTPEYIIENMKKFGWNIEPYLESGNLDFVDFFSWKTNPLWKPEKNQYGVRISPLNLDKLEMGLELLQDDIKGAPSRIIMDCLSTSLTDVDSEEVIQVLKSFITEGREQNTGVFTLAKGVLPDEIESSFLELFDVVAESKLEFGAEPKKFFRIVKSSLGPFPSMWFQYNITSNGFEIYKPPGLSL